MITLFLFKVIPNVNKDLLYAHYLKKYLSSRKNIMNFKYCMLLQIYQYVNILSLLHKSIKYLSPLVFQNFIFLKLKGVTQSICLETKEI